MSLWPIVGTFLVLIQGKVRGQQNDDVAEKTVPEYIQKNMNITTSTPSSLRTTREDLAFKLFNKDIPNGVYISRWNSTDYLKSLFRSGKPLKMVSPGWTKNETSESVLRIINAYLKTQDVNAIGVGVKSIAQSDFFTAADSVPGSGGKVAEMIEHLVDIGVATLDKIHLIGHSLGAHVMGVAGASLTKGKVARITGLDPAGPIFQLLNNLRMQLDASDATFVDVIHTAGSTYGYKKAIGHADFFPNGGDQQPGCKESMLMSCSHSRAWELYEESLYHPETFLAEHSQSWEEYTKGDRKLNSTALMGDATRPTARGSYFLRTYWRPPLRKS